jgi:hypothetical protein
MLKVAPSLRDSYLLLLRSDTILDDFLLLYPAC